MRFLLEEVIGLDRIAALPGCESVTSDLVGDVLAEAGRFAGEVIAPLNRPGDIEGSRLENGVVITPAGFAGGYEGLLEGGRGRHAAGPGYGGPGMTHGASASAQA